MLSRVLGMARDMATAYRFGASAVMDALVLALRIPDLFRRLFGEGVLGASLIPTFSKLLEDRDQAWRFLSAALIATCSVPLLLVLAGEGICWWLLNDAPPATNADSTLAIQLTQLLLPYVTLVCILAQLAAALQAMGRFTTPALAPCLLNLGWITACVAAPWIAEDLPTQAKALAIAVLASGALQVAWLWQDLHRQGFRRRRPTTLAWRQLRGSLSTLLPTALAIAATQINTTIDGLAAWWLSAQGVLPIGAASAVYFGERLFMLPVGVVGITTAVVFFPTLCKFAEQQRHEEIADHVHRALRGMWLLAIPSSVGLVLLAKPVVAMLLEHGEFDPEASLRAARVTAAYGIGIWAFAALPLLVRVELALGRSRQAALAGATMVILHGAPVLVIGRWGGEMAVAGATTLTAVLQCAWIWVSLATVVPLRLRSLGTAVTRITLSATVMGCVVTGATRWLTPNDGGNMAALPLLVVIATAAVVHLTFERLLRRVLVDSP